LKVGFSRRLDYQLSNFNYQLTLRDLVFVANGDRHYSESENRWVGSKKTFRR